uniref:Uncharacterized protein n=1 Tax=Eptatretus burgeri TaxID=7764 RepID=A0A8C4R1Y3_EPTBU
MEGDVASGVPPVSTMGCHVTFPMNLDVFPLCSAGLKRSSLTQRQRKGENAGKLSNIESTAQRTLQAFDILRVDTGATSNGLYKLRAVISYDRSSVPVGHYLAWLSGKKGNMLVTMVWGCQSRVVSPHHCK